MSHEFLSPTEKEQPEYKDCLNCGKRKSLVCLICGYCYECHPAIEAIEEKKPTKVPFNISKLDDIEEPLS
jgi:hypothetical protein